MNESKFKVLWLLQSNYTSYMTVRTICNNTHLSDSQVRRALDWAVKYEYVRRIESRQGSEWKITPKGGGVVVNEAKWHE